MQLFLITIFAILALSAAFVPSRFAVQSKSALFAACEEKLQDKKGRCPGETGYMPITREAPTDFAAYMAAEKAKKAAAAAPAASESRCPGKEDKNKRCPGEAGYFPITREAPASFADFKKSKE